MASQVSGARSGAAVRRCGGAAVRSSERIGIGSGWLVFAAVLMIFGGLMMICAAIAAIAEDDVFASTRNHVYEGDLIGWGWIHLIMGVAITLAGAAVFQGATSARGVGMALAGLAMLANFLWNPYAPLGALVLVAINGFVIWALCAAPQSVRAMKQRMASRCGPTPGPYPDRRHP
ncbi:hypothetical protein [Streptomyces europaeiscabiei]|uniref:DUF7144 family membrane protein n=1 Tax=Streptomyces europaeiscabiei TaxID=146819 RepID=UPI002E2DF283|nr:hypothetical protein [Streptomyces europaeiscabiei]